MSEAEADLSAIIKLRYLPRWIMIGFMWLAAQLPFSWQMRAGRFIGRLLGRYSHFRRKVVETNLLLCFPEISEAERRKLLVRVFESIGMGLIELQMAWWMSEKRLRQLVTIDGQEHLEAVRAQGKGVVLLSAHFTMLEIATGMLSFFMSFDITYREHKDPFWDTIQLWRRKRAPGLEQAFSRKETRGILKALRKKHIVWFAPDQDFGREQTIFVPFFGIQASTITSTMRLAKLGNASVVPFRYERLADDRGYHLGFGKALDEFPCGDDKADAGRINRLFESMIREKPHEYLWSHRRFKTRPKGQLKLYPPKRGRNRRRPGE